MAENTSGTVENPPQDGAAPPAQAENVDGQQQQQRPGGWAIFKTLAIRMLFIYMISSFFRRSPTPTDGDGKSVKALTATNIFSKAQRFDLYVYLTESEHFTDFSSDLFWLEEDLSYGDWTGGLNEDGTYEKSANVQFSDKVMHNGTIFMHAFVVKGGTSPDPKSVGYDALYAIHRFKQLNKYKKKVYHTTVNLLTGIVETFFLF